jgi:DNA-binding beta-propeller fold protein YncE
MQGDPVASRIDFSAPQHVCDVVSSLGRTEDIKFSPSNRRMAVAELWDNRITVFDISISSKSVALTDAAQISSPHLKSPHGLDFVDDERIIVVNRDGKACVFKLPFGASGRFELEPEAIIVSDKISTPGSVAVVRDERGSNAVLISNTYSNSISRHSLELDNEHPIDDGRILLKRWINIPDGLCVSHNMQWIAISNHNVHNVMLYKNSPDLNGSSDPDGILLRTNYPHGLRFTSDEKFVVVSNAGSPYVNVYERGGADWRGIRYPLLSFRALSDDEFLLARSNRQEGGVKGIDIDNGGNVFVATCGNQPLAFFDWAAILNGSPSTPQTSGALSSLFPRNWLPKEKTVGMKYELYRGRIIGALADGLRWALTKLRTFSGRELALHRKIPQP